MEELKEEVLSVLPNLVPPLLEEVCEQLISKGVETVPDLKFIIPTDLPMLRDNQVRKLLDKWTQAATSTQTSQQTIKPTRGTNGISCSRTSKCDSHAASPRHPFTADSLPVRCLRRPFTVPKGSKLSQSFRTRGPSKKASPATPAIQEAAPTATTGEGEEAVPTPTLNLQPGEAEVVGRMEDDHHETEDDDDDDDDDYTSSQRPAVKRRKKNPSVILTDEQERALAQWLETEGEFIYNRGRTAYKDKAKIARAFQEQGAKLDPPVSGVELRTWFSSLRSRYGRLTNTISGQGPTSRRYTDREKWILELFPFLRPHIVRQHRTAHLGLSQNNNGGPGPSGIQQEAQVASTVMSESPNSEDVEQQPTPVLARPRPPRKAPNGKHGEALSMILETAREALNDLGQMRAIEDPQKEHWRSFFDGLMPHLLRISPSTQMLFKMELMAAVRVFSEVPDEEAEDHLLHCMSSLRGSKRQRAPEPPQPLTTAVLPPVVVPQQVMTVAQVAPQVTVAPNVPVTLTPAQVAHLQAQLLRSPLPGSSLGGVDLHNLSATSLSSLHDTLQPGTPGQQPATPRAPCAEEVASLETPPRINRQGNVP